MIQPDPNDKGADQFVNRRAGYGNKWERVYAVAKAGGTLYAGEGKLLTDRIEQLEKELAEAKAPEKPWFDGGCNGVCSDHYISPSCPAHG